MTRGYMSRGRVLVLFAMMLVLLAATAFLRRDIDRMTPGHLINADIMGLLPQLSNTPAEQAARHHITRLYGSRVYLAARLSLANGNASADIVSAEIAGADIPGADSGTRQQDAWAALHTGLSDLPFIRAVRDLQDEAPLRALAETYYRQPAAFLSDNSRDLLREGDAGQIARQAWKTLTSPGGFVNGSLFQADPAFLVQERFRSLQAAAGDQASLSDTRLFVLELDPGLRDVADRIEWVQTFRALQRTLPDRWPGLTINATGPIFHEAFAAGQARNDVTLLSILSLAIIGAVILGVFRNIWPLIGAHIVMAVAFLTALLAALAIFDRLHVMSLVFATILFGLSLDYAIHFYVYRQNNRSMTLLARSMLPAMGSSMLGLASLVFMPADVTRQMAVLTIAGLAGAAIAALCILPALHKTGQIPISLAWATGPARLHAGIIRVKWPLCLIVLLVALTQWPLVQGAIDDDVRRLGNTDPVTRQQEQELKAYMPVDGGTAMLMLVATDHEQALQQAETLYPQLKTWQTDGVISGWTSLSGLMPSQQRQADNIRLVQNKLVPALSALHPMLPDNPYQQRPANAARLSELPAGIFGGLAGNLAFTLVDGRALHLISLHQVRSGDDLASFLATRPDITFLNPRNDVSAAFAFMRENLMTAFGLTLVIVPVMAVIYWQHWSGIILVLPSLVAVTLPLPVAVWAGYPVNFFSMVALFLVLALSLDYCLFMANSRQDRQTGTWLAVTLSALSSIAAFAVLLLSSVPVVQMIGIAVACGLSVGWILSPIARVARSIKYAEYD